MVLVLLATTPRQGNGQGIRAFTLGQVSRTLPRRQEWDQ